MVSRCTIGTLKMKRTWKDMAVAIADKDVGPSSTGGSTRGRTVEAPSHWGRILGFGCLKPDVDTPSYKHTIELTIPAPPRCRRSKCHRQRRRPNQYGPVRQTRRQSPWVDPSSRCTRRTRQRHRILQRRKADTRILRLNGIAVADTRLQPPPNREHSLSVERIGVVHLVDFGGSNKQGKGLVIITSRQDSITRARTRAAFSNAFRSGLSGSRMSLGQAGHEGFVGNENSGQAERFNVSTLHSKPSGTFTRVYSRL